MTEQQLQLALRFIQNYRHQFPPQRKYLPDPKNPPIIATSTSNFITSRGVLMYQFLHSSPQSPFHLCQAFAAEQLVKLALTPLVDTNGFCSHLAPQSLERGGQNQKGVDLIITDSDNLSYLGVDVKLRTGKSSRDRDGFGWHNTLKSPYIYLSLGNWSIDSRQGEVSIKQWLKTCVCPQILSSGKIPYLDKFRSYLVGRIERSLNGYIETLRHPSDYGIHYGLPSTRQETILLSQKLSVLQALFTDIETNI